MNLTEHNELEESLRDLAWWKGPVPGTWKKALWLSSRQTPKSGRIHRLLRSRWRWITAPIAAVLATAIVISTWERNSELTRAVSSANLRSMGPGFYGIPSDYLWQDSQRLYSGDTPHIIDSSVMKLPDAGGHTQPGRYYYSIAEPRRPLPPASFISPSAAAAASDYGKPVGDRHVIRKASIDLQADDVRGVYLKIQTLVPSEAEGEYVEQSQIHGSGAELGGYLTLRVRSERLPTVLDTLRGLAEVMREQTDATDVTTQVIDREARLRNERRIEQELLDLLDQRQNAPLEDVLKLSESLSGVRERIERLTAEQQYVHRQVALATVVVTIRGQESRPAIGLGSQFRDRLSAAWTSGMSLLIGSIAALAQVLVGGLLFWTFLIAGVWLARHWYLRRAT